MIQNLFKHGNDLAVVIDSSILSSLGIDESTPLAVTVTGREIKLSPIESTGLSPERFEELHDSINQRYAKTFKRLAEES
jgi:antitoxin component of MazEF toxin-antitoxin module